MTAVIKIPDAELFRIFSAATGQARVKYLETGVPYSGSHFVPHHVQLVDNFDDIVLSLPAQTRANLLVIEDHQPDGLKFVPLGEVCGKQYGFYQ